jgi:hypothetical protein
MKKLPNLVILACAALYAALGVGGFVDLLHAGVKTTTLRAGYGISSRAMLPVAAPDNAGMRVAREGHTDLYR